VVISRRVSLLLNLFWALIGQSQPTGPRTPEEPRRRRGQTRRPRPTWGRAATSWLQRASRAPPRQHDLVNGTNRSTGRAATTMPRFRPQSRHGYAGAAAAVGLPGCLRANAGYGHNKLLVPSGAGRGFKRDWGGWKTFDGDARELFSATGFNCCTDGWRKGVLREAPPVAAAAFSSGSQGVGGRDGSAQVGWGGLREFLPSGC
jgi:hypothetical protein